MNPRDSSPLRDALTIDCQAESCRIASKMRQLLVSSLRRRGLVIAVSGGVDSSVTLALAVKAVGSRRVLALMMPERDSARVTLHLSRLVAAHVGCDTQHEDVTQILEAVGYYARYNRAVRSVVPEYSKDWKSKIISPNVMKGPRLSLFSLVVEKPDGEQLIRRLPLEPYLEIVAATNFKQRIRKTLEYYHADRLHYAVAGTPNRLEYDQGFFVKQGDGCADIKPIAHLYKSQVYQLAEFLGVPEEIRRRQPTTDTYSLSQGQDEFYFSLPWQEFDLCLFALNQGIEPGVVAQELGYEDEQIRAVYEDIRRKRSTTRYLHLPPHLIEEVLQLPTATWSKEHNESNGNYP